MVQIDRVACARRGSNGKRLGRVSRSVRTIEPHVKQPFRRLVWLAPIALALHEAEEWNILRWYQEFWNNVGRLSNTTIRTWLVFNRLLGFAVTGVATRFRSPRATAWIIVSLMTLPFVYELVYRLVGRRT
jgi:hypothetical protein